jgi:hypothetical protein
MRKSFIFALALLFISISLSSQIVTYGVSPQFNNATQLVKNPGKPADGTFQWNSINTFGVASFVELEHAKNLNSLIRLGYSRKGFIDPVQVGLGNNEINDKKVKNTFDYLNLDLLGKVHLNKELINPYFMAGLQASYLLAKDMEEFPDLYTLSQFPDYSKYKKFSMGYLLGAGIEIDKLISLDISMNMDFLNPVRTDELRVRNWVWTAGLNINVNRVIDLI